MKLLSTLGVVVFLLVLLTISFNCDTAVANPYQALYEKQIVITDSIKTVLMAQVNLVSLISNRKIDSLKTIEYGLRYQLANVACDSAAIIRNHHVTQTTPYLFVPLNQRLTEIIDSLNRK